MGKAEADASATLHALSARTGEPGHAGVREARATQTREDQLTMQVDTLLAKLAELEATQKKEREKFRETLAMKSTHVGFGRG